MDDLISRELALKESHKIVIEGEVFDVVQVESLLGLPSVDPERKRGKWIVINSRPAFLWLRCSECGHGNDTKTNYCPNCGAKMENE